VCRPDGDGSSLKQVVSWVPQEPSAPLCRWSARIEQAVPGYVTHAAGQAFMLGGERLVAEVGAEGA
jgi:hypothetical protein